MANPDISSSSTQGVPADWIASVAARQDKAAFARLFLRFAPKLKSYFLRAGFPPAEAEDLAQDVMLAVWRKAALFDSSKAEPWGWIYAIARNLRVDQHRRAARRAAWPVDGTPSSVDPNAQIEQADAVRRVNGALCALPGEQFTVVRLAYFDDKPHSEIARRLSLPLGTVKSRLRRAAARLRVSLSE
jgi:RNA polymerase sigma-70 factor (ECF subfamily)